MTIIKKQIKITKHFRKGGGRIRARPTDPEDCNEINEEIQQLQETLKQKKDELFQLQRNSYKRKHSPSQSKTETFIRPQKIVIHNSVETLKRKIHLMSMLTGMEVQSYISNNHCCIVYHMQHDSDYVVKHGFRIDLSTGKNVISQSSMPLGFNLQAVLEDFDNIMMPDCLGAIRKALVAYYNRLEQYNALKKLLNIDGQLFKAIDGSHIEVSFNVKNVINEEDEETKVVLMLDYRVYDIRPKTITFKDTDLPEGVEDAMLGQSALLKKKPLHKAFRDCFIECAGPYQLIKQIGASGDTSQRRRIKLAPRHHNDDTFRPEECSDSESDHMD